MFPALPSRPRRALAAVILLLMAAVALAHAFTLSPLRLTRDGDDWLWADLTLTDPIEPRVARSLARGMPATLELHAELWRRRSGWFDRMERAFDAELRLRYDVWKDAWRLERAGAAPIVVSDLDSLERALERPIALPVAALSRLPATSRCYVVVTATLRPLDVEDAEQVEGWISGEVRRREGGVTAVPRAVFDAVRNFAGFGDLRARARSEDFSPASLPGR